MYEFITVLIIVACIILILVVLIQNPKGGGLSQSFGGFSNQIMGVKRTTDFLEKSTWTLIGAVTILSLFTVFFIPKNITAEKPKSELEQIEQNAAPVRNMNAPPANTPANTQQTAPSSNNPAPTPAGNPLPASTDTNQ